MTHRDLGLLCALAILTPKGCGAVEAGEFSFEYVQHAGYGETPIRIIVSGTEATLIRQQSRSNGDAIGVFRARLSGQQRSALEKAVPEHVDSPVPATRDGAYYVIRLTTPTRKVHLRIAQDPTAMAPVEGLMRELGAIESGLPWTASRTLRLELSVRVRQVIAGKPTQMAVVFRASGDKSVGVVAQSVSLEAMAATEPPRVPGVTPRPRYWDRVSAAVAAQDIEIPAGGSVEVPVTVTISGTKDMILRARYEVRGNTDLDNPRLCGIVMSQPVDVQVR